MTQSKVSENITRPDTKRVLTNSTASTSNNYIRLTDEEAAKKRKLGLCFICDEKFGPNHKCKKELKILMLSEDTEELDETKEECIEGERELTTLT